MDLRENKYIKFPIQLEQYLMEGTYRKVEEVQNTRPCVLHAAANSLCVSAYACNHMCSRARIHASQLASGSARASAHQLQADEYWGPCERAGESWCLLLASLSSGAKGPAGTILRILCE